VTQTNSFSLFLSYQAQAERNYQRAIAEFERLKALRGELSEDQIGFVPQTPLRTQKNPARNKINLADPPTDESQLSESLSIPEISPATFTAEPPHHPEGLFSCQ